ncbi:STAS domain-containing protein [Actinomadura fulvescens]|uniref:hypothetical protein n=1 Tax=Actinomadura fulvescens TaxID=46160 RepID=UPI00397C7D1E
MASAGLNLLAGPVPGAAPCKGSSVLVGVRPDLRGLLRITGLTRLFPIYRTVGRRCRRTWPIRPATFPAAAPASRTATATEARTAPCWTRAVAGAWDQRSGMTSCLRKLPTRQ